MFDLYTLSDFYLFLILSFVAIFISIIAIHIVKRYVPEHVRYADNQVIGNVSSLVGIIYGVLAGLMALYLLNNIMSTSDAVQREANAAANIYREIHWLSSPTRDQVQTDIVQYLQHVINVEWPLMGENKMINMDGEKMIFHISSLIEQYPLTPISNIILPQLITQIDRLYDAREQRIHMSKTALNREIWFVILIGTSLTLAMNYLFAMNMKLHIITVSAASLITMAMIFLLITLDRPFQGEFSVDNDPLKSVLMYIQQVATAPGNKQLIQTP